MSTPPSPSGTESLLRFDSVSMRFDEIVALESVSFDLHAGETRVVLRRGRQRQNDIAQGCHRTDSSRLGENISVWPGDYRLKEAQLFEIRSGVGVLFQEGGLFDSVTVEENVAYPLLNRKNIPNSIQEAETKVREALRFVELEQTLEQYPAELSGGMRRRVGIARAVVSEPPLVLYDSPTAGLDPITATTIMALIAKERDSRRDRQPDRYAALSGRAIDGQLPLQSQQRTFGASIH